jgi:heavy metal sensor kinase
MPRVAPFPLLVRHGLGSIRARLTLWYVAILALTLAGYSAILMISLARGLDAGLDRLLNDEVRQASGVLSVVADDRELREEFRRLNVGTVVGLYDPDSARLIAGRPLPAPLIRPEPISGQTRVDILTLPDGTRWRMLTLEVAQLNQPSRVLVVARSEGFVGPATNQLLMVVGVTAPLALMLAIIGGAFLAQRALKPIDQIRRTADAIGAEDLSRRLGLTGQTDEVGRLAVTFDHMLERLDQAFERQRRFTADASHELRTPLAMLVSRAGLALERRRTTREYESVLRAIRDDGLRMARMVNDLLMLARSDAGDALAVREHLDAGEMIRSVTETMAPRASERGIELSMEAEQDVAVIGDQTRLTQLLVNVVDNALTHTSQGGRVHLSAGRADGSVLLRVADTGSGIAPEHLPHVFQRFFRADRDRGQEGGAGLGLALCHSIALAHGGDIRLESKLGEGTCVSVTLPLAPIEDSADGRGFALNAARA